MRTNVFPKMLLPKLLLVCAFVILVNAQHPKISAEMKEKMGSLTEGCLKESGAGPDDLQPMMAKQPPTTPEGKCFVYCLHRGLKFQEDSGKIDKVSIFQWIDGMVPIDPDYAVNMRKVANTCMEDVDDSKDKCQVAVDMFVCYTRVSKELGINMP